MTATPTAGGDHVAHPPDRFTPETDLIGRIATVPRIVAVLVPILGMTITPLLPFAKTPTLWFGVPAVMIWIAVMVLLSVAVLQVIDRGILRQAQDAGAPGGDAS